MAATSPVRAPMVMPTDVRERYMMLSLYGGFHVTLASGDFFIEGTLLTVVHPKINGGSRGVLVTIDTGTERVSGPVLAGDRLYA
jgi:hypothetical protein